MYRGSVCSCVNVYTHLAAGEAPFWLQMRGCVCFTVNCADFCCCFCMSANHCSRMETWENSAVFYKIPPPLAWNFTFCGPFVSSCRKRPLITLPPLHIFVPEVMEVAPNFLFLLCVCLRVSLAADWEFDDTNFTYLDDAIDYKDPCKAGSVHFTSSTNLLTFYIWWFLYNVFMANSHRPWALWARLIMLDKRPLMMYI